MEEKDQVNKPSAPIIDVQPPQQDIAEPANARTETTVPTPTVEPGQQLVAPAPPLSEDEASVPAAETAAEPSEAPAVVPAHQAALVAPKKQSGPVVAIVVAIIVAVILAAVTVLAFTSKKKTGTLTTNNKAALRSEATPITPKAVDETSAELDTALNTIDEAADFPEAELSDQILGL